ncbi:bifunctional protein-disulfide isomerase/oxidoreductase DsbC [Vibrio comitans]|uniref:Thiol:disulfide interchange protein n=1 Tax=Vibrio comitans NBRC 102076 TaxID=1219078 RepID=A0A4Y3IL69_9VIBR|nr:bifunctional protein-disulfide isomerase/oxidoreductase DsbC [Vibrio comitans]GEA60279.1 thiol:disulfide interchange protein DsbC [Vibrio comitans NBRC 102076]
MNILGRVFGVVMCSLLAFSVSATEFNEAQIKERFAKIGVSVMQIDAIEVDGLVEVTTNQGTFYATPTADYFIPGKLYSLDDKGNFQDVAALRNGPKIVSLLDQASDEMIVYKADNEKYVVTVFTDISCGYCLKLHRQMAEYNKLGITVRYLAFPRAGDRSDIGQTMANIWCSADPAKAMNDAKLRGENVNASSDSIQQCQTMVSEQYQLGKAIGVSGTPAVYTSKGMNVGGYLSPEDLLKRLESQG